MTLHRLTRSPDIRKRALAVAALLCTGSVGGIFFLNGRDNQRIQVPHPPGAAREPSSSAPGPVSRANRKASALDDKSTPEAWNGPPFLRFFAHDPTGSQELGVAYGRWSRIDLALAGKVAGLAGERAAEATPRAAWNQAELETALQWAGGLSEGGSKFALMAELGKRLFAFDRAAAVALGGQLEDDPHFDAYLSEIVEEWAVTDPEGSSAWVGEFPPGGLRDHLELKVAIRSAEDEPAAAAGYVAVLDPGPVRDTAARTVTRQWAASDPHAALEWAARYPRQELRDELLSTAVAYWKRLDEPGFLRWIREDPADPTRRTAEKLSAGLQP